ncbi:MAG: glycoside hydrolase, partial [Ferruginibacter sp.]|nr:glycoside hydrolase [Ferruginibacter sp.]
AGDTSLLNFSGTGRYTTSFQLPVKPGGEYLLKLDRLCESARVIINGKDAGLIWSVPYQLRIGKYLQPGVNTISLEVSNLMANRIRYMDRHKMEWRKYHEINFVNINYKNFNAAEWSVQPSGLEGPVTILPLK